MLLGTLRIFRAVPAGLIEDEDRMSASSDLGGDLIEMKLHGLAVAGGQHQGGTGPEFGADRTEQIGRLRALAGLYRGRLVGEPSGPCSLNQITQSRRV